MKTILVYGLRRSGNHLILSSILQQFKTCIHINDTQLSYEQYMRFKDEPITASRKDRKYTGFKDADCVVISMENKEIDQTEIDKFKNIDDVYTVLILRNPYNNLASAWRVYRKIPKPIKGRCSQILNMWVGYGEQFISNNSLVKILYDEFVSSEQYRIKSMTALGITDPHIDCDIHIRWQCSSYNNDKNSKRCWGELEDSVYANDKDFLDLFTEPTIKSTWDKIKQSFN